MNLLDYSRDQIKEFVQAGICSVETLRDYDVLKAVKSGAKAQDIAFDNNISRVHVYRIKEKYMR